MIKLTAFDPYTYRIEYWEVRVPVQNILYIESASDRGRSFSRVHLIIGKHLSVYESANRIEEMISAALLESGVG